MTTKATKQEIKLLEVDVALRETRVKGARIKYELAFSEVAECYKKQYDALIRKGFSDEQALQIVISMKNLES